MKINVLNTVMEVVLIKSEKHFSNCSINFSLQFELHMFTYFFAKIGILKANKVECRKSFGSDIPMWYIVFGDRIATHSCMHLFSCLKYSWVNLFWMVIYSKKVFILFIFESVKSLIYYLILSINSSYSS